MDHAGNGVLGGVVFDGGRLYLQRSFQMVKSELAGWFGAVAFANQSAGAAGELPGSVVGAAVANTCRPYLDCVGRRTSLFAIEPHTNWTEGCLVLDARHASWNFDRGRFCRLNDGDVDGAPLHIRP